MARSNAIWVVEHEMKILGTFTVKWQMIAEIARSDLPLEFVWVRRYADGEFSEPYWLPFKELKELVEKDREILHRNRK